MANARISSASADDVRRIQARRNVDDLTMRLSLAAAEGGTAFVSCDEGEPVALALAQETADERYVGELFVEPSFRGQGLGAALLDAAFAEAGDVARAMAYDTADVAAAALGMRRGIGPKVALLRLAGSMPREEVLMAMAAGDYRFEVGEIAPARHAFALTALDREMRGTVRDHEELAETATGQAFFLRGEMVAYAYCRSDGRVGPMAVSSAAYLVQIFGFVLATLQRTYGASWCTLLVPSANVRVARAALRAGLRIEESWTFASDTGNADFSRYVAFHRYRP